MSTQINQSGFVVPPLLIGLIVTLLGVGGFLLYKNTVENGSTDQVMEGTIFDDQESTPSASASLLAKPAVQKSVAPSASVSATNSPANTNNTSESNNANNNSGSSPSGNTNSTTQQNSPDTTVASPTPAPVQENSQSFSDNGLTVKASCSGSELQLYISGNIPSPNSREEGIWMVLEDRSNGQKMIYEYTGNQGPPTTKVAANIPPTGAIRGSSITLSGDGRNYIARAYAAPYVYSGLPNLNTIISEVSFNRKCQ